MGLIARCWVAMSDDDEHIVTAVHGGPPPPTRSPGDGFVWVEYVHADLHRGAVAAERERIMAIARDVLPAQPYESLRLALAEADPPPTGGR